MSPSEPPSGTASKRSSPPVNAPAAKRMKNDDSNGTNTAGSSGQISTSTPGAAAPPPGTTASTSTNTVDPDQLSDALLSAGVDLKEEENLLSSTLQEEMASSQQQQAGTKAGSGSYNQQFGRQKILNDFLDVRQVSKATKRPAQDAGVVVPIDKDNDLSQLLSISCQEWMTEIITDMVALNRHRRRSRNDAHSEIGRALRQLAIKDKEAEDKRVAQKALMGLEASEEDKRLGSEESQYRNANATALMMTGKKKYSWLSGGAGGGGPGGAGGGPAGGPRGGRNETNIRYREAREEPQLALRDLLGALEDRRMGVEKVVVKGYARLKN